MKVFSSALFTLSLTVAAANGQRQLPDYPEFRFVDFQTLSNNTQPNVHYSAVGLDYDRASWNSPGTNPIEDLTFAAIATTNDVNLVLYMGFSPSVWDCWVNHYMGYSWLDLISINLDTAAETLGFNETTWGFVMSDSSAVGTTAFDKSWIMLTSEEKMAASELCYIQELWDEDPIDQWVASTSPTSSPTSFPSDAPSENTSNRDGTAPAETCEEDPPTCTAPQHCCSNMCNPPIPGGDGTRTCRKLPSPVSANKERLGANQNRGGAGGQSSIVPLP